MNGRDFLGTAQFLLSSGTDEAAHRSAISRAYYACFLAAREVAFEKCDKSVLLRDSISRPSGIRHTRLLQFLRYAPIPAVKGLGDDLATLYGNRRDADYEMSEHITDDDAEDAIKMAETFLVALTATHPADIRTAIHTFINDTYR